MYACVLSRSVVSYSLLLYGLYPTRGSPGKNTGVGCHAFLQGIFLTRNRTYASLCPLHWQAGSLPLVPLYIFSKCILETLTVFGFYNYFIFCLIYVQGEDYSIFLTTGLSSWPMVSH